MEQKRTPSNRNKSIIHKRQMNPELQQLESPKVELNIPDK